VIFIASDHAAIDLRRHLIAVLRDRDHEVEDLGTDDVGSVDYPDFAHAVADRVAADPDHRGVLVCGTGIGMAMAANRHRGVRAAVCHDAFTAEMARRHNDANVLCVGARVIGPGVAEQVVTVFMDCGFDGGRHARRIAKIDGGESAAAGRRGD
jgi:ribose 5-phosphate isomerase B